MRSRLPPPPAPGLLPLSLPHIMQALTDKLKGMSTELLFATTRHGDLHLQVHTAGERALPQPS